MMATAKELQTDRVEAQVTKWHENFFAVEYLLLHVSPVYYGYGVPRGDGSPVIIIPGFLHTDIYLLEMYAWLKRIGYRPYYSGISLNADCPDLLIRDVLVPVLNKARRDTGQRAHLVGHSLGGLLARSLAVQRP